VEVALDAPGWDGVAANATAANPDVAAAKSDVAPQVPSIAATPTALPTVTNGTVAPALVRSTPAVDLQRSGSGALALVAVGGLGFVLVAAVLTRRAARAMRGASLGAHGRRLGPSSASGTAGTGGVPSHLL